MYEFPSIDFEFLVLGLHGLEPHDKQNEARCAALVKGEGSFDDIVFEVVTHEMSGPANYGYPVEK